MAEPFHYILLGAAALLASTVAAVTGTGGGVLLLPVMVVVFGVRDAVPMYAVAQLIGNLGRVVFNRREIRLPVALWFVAGAVPMAVVGAWVFSQSSETILVRLLGVFLLGSVIGHRLMRKRFSDGFAPAWFVPIGAVFAFMSALIGSAGPFLAPFFLAFGLVKGAYIGTEALGTAIMHVAKLIAYDQAGVLSATAIWTGLSLAPIMILGSYLGKRIVDRVSPRVFVLAIEAILLIFGLWFLVRG